MALADTETIGRKLVKLTGIFRHRSQIRNKKVELLLELFKLCSILKWRRRGVLKQNKTYIFGKQDLLPKTTMPTVFPYVNNNSRYRYQFWRGGGWTVRMYSGCYEMQLANKKKSKCILYS